MVLSAVAKRGQSYSLSMGSTLVRRVALPTRSAAISASLSRGTHASSTWSIRTKSYSGDAGCSNAQDHNLGKKVLLEERGRRAEGERWRETVSEEASSCQT